MKIESPVTRFPGHVILPEFLNIGQVRAFEDALGDPDAGQVENKKVWISLSDERRLPAVLQCVQEWHIQGVPEKPTLETFPMTPLVPAHDLLNWIFGELLKMWTGETEIPNA